MHKAVSLISILSIVLSTMAGCLGSDEDERPLHAIEWEKFSLDEGGIFSPHPLQFSMDMEFVPNSDRVVISEWPQNDVDPPVISTWRIDQGVMEKVGYDYLLERGDVVYSGGSQCGIKLAVDPDDDRSLIVFRCMSNTSVTIERYDLTSEGVLISESKEVLVSYDTGNDWGSFEHLVGEIEFGSEGFLWVFMGYGNMDNTSQDPMSPFGSVLRMQLGPLGLEAAPNNPAENNSSWHPMVFSKGLRMPWTAAQDESGNWWVGDVGEFQYERIQVIERGGQNFGFYKHVWIEKEDENCISCEDLKEPILTYTRDNNHSFMIEDEDSHESFFAAIWVGEQVPSSPSIPSNISSKIIFGDFTRGFVRASDSNATGESEHIGHLVGVVDIEVKDGEVFALTTGVQVSKEVSDPGFWKMIFY